MTNLTQEEQQLIECVRSLGLYDKIEIRVKDNRVVYTITSTEQKSYAV